MLIAREKKPRIRAKIRRRWHNRVEAGKRLVRSRAETKMFQVKAVYGEKVSARKLDGQAVQLLVRGVGLNRMNQLAQPKSYQV